MNKYGEMHNVVFILGEITDIIDESTYLVLTVHDVPGSNERYHIHIAIKLSNKIAKSNVVKHLKPGQRILVEGSLYNTITDTNTIIVASAIRLI